MTDEKLETLEAAASMCSPEAHWGNRPRDCCLIQRDLVRQEIWRREARLCEKFGSIEVFEMAAFQQQLSAHIGKRIVIKFDKDHSYGGVLQETRGDCLVLLIDNGNNRLIVQIPQVQFFYEG